jgi:hypothetical protein
VAQVNVNDLLSVPYRTGSYLIYDAAPGKDHFRTAMGLDTHPYPASGSHQLDVKVLTKYLSQVIAKFGTKELFLVDLREETHGFLGDTAVSWYADNDFANVGMSPGLVQRDEEARLAALAGEETVDVFTIGKDKQDNRKQQRVLPLTCDSVSLKMPQTERQAFDQKTMGGCTVNYVRLPVTGHCWPSEKMLSEFCTAVPVSADPATTWVHFHCHGGDGRTTSFLALYDIRCWKASGDTLPDDMDFFAARQCQIFDSYCLNPDPAHCENCTTDLDPWKVSRAEVRWQVLSRFLAGQA